MQPDREGNARETVREEAVNTLLTEALRGRGLAARAERKSRRQTPDVRINLKSRDSVILECKWAGSANLLSAQLDERLERDKSSLAAVGVLYPDWMKPIEDLAFALAATIGLRWWLHGTKGKVSEERLIHEGSVADLADYLRALPLELEGVDRVATAAGIVEFALERSADEMAKHARTAFRVAQKIAETDQEVNRVKARRIAALVLFNALAFQDRLAGVNEEVKSVEEAWRGGVPGLQDEWQKICKSIDYVPVFELALQILDVLRDVYPLLQAESVEPLIRAMEDTRGLEGHDLSGRLFHTLLSDAKFTGAYYTSVPAATLLSRLVFHNWPPHIDWKDHEFPGALNIADLACGTGTLLMAVAAEAGRRHLDAGGQQSAALHKAMVERAIHGYDVQLSAIHFAATSLAMLNTDIQFDRMNLYVMPYGSDGAKVSLGSLDFLGNDEVPVQFALSPDISGGAIREAAKVYGNGGTTAANGETVRLPRLDLAIMNPPFTRSVAGNLLFGSLPAGERSQLQKELRRRLKSRQATGTAGLGAAFVATATPKLHPGEGRLALVLPATVCTGPSWEQTRALIEKDFALNMVVASHDPRRYNFSDSTDLSEVLLIATRRPVKGKAGKPPETRTVFVNLWQNPGSVGDAHRVAQGISATTPANFEDSGTGLLEVEGRHIGELISIPESRFASKQWFGVQFARGDVIRSAMRFVNDGEVWVPGGGAPVQIPTCRFDELGAIGPDIRDVRDGFVPTDSVTAYPMVENHDTENRKRIATIPDRYLAPRVDPLPGRKLKALDQLWPKAGRLLVGARLWLNTSRVVAMLSDTPVLASMWWPVSVENPMLEKALTVWLNSSVGILSLLAIRNTTRGGWVQPKKADLEGFPVLDGRALSPDQLAALSRLFDTLAEAEFERLPGMVDCPARRDLDDGLSEILGLPNLEGLRRLLASEPVVSNRRL